MFYIEVTGYSKKGEIINRVFLNGEYTGEKLEKELEIFRCNKKDVTMLLKEREILTKDLQIKLRMFTIVKTYSRYSMRVAHLHSGDRIVLHPDATWKIKYSKISWMKEFLYKLTKRAYQAD